MLGSALRMLLLVVLYTATEGTFTGTPQNDKQGTPASNLKDSGSNKTSEGLNKNSDGLLRANAQTPEPHEGASKKRVKEIGNPLSAAERVEEFRKENGLSEEDVTCNADLIYAFGVFTQIIGPHVIAPTEKNYCRNNRISCCSVAHIEDTRKRFHKGLSKMHRNLDIIEELLTLFKGKQHERIRDAILEDYASRQECTHILESGVDRSADFTTEQFYTQKANDLANLLIDMEYYTKRLMWFYGNLLCTICNPINHRHFKVSLDKMEMEVHSSTCMGIIEIKDFEIRLHDLYSNFIAKLANFVACKSGGKVNLVPPYPSDEIDRQSRKYKKCLTPSFKLANPACKDLCSRSILSYRFPVDILSAARSALKILFDYLTEKPINAYYKRVKGREYPEDNIDIDSPIQFYKMNDNLFRKLNLHNIEWNVSLDTGITIFADHMSKKFTSYQIEPHKGISLADLFGFLFR